MNNRTETEIRTLREYYTKLRNYAAQKASGHANPDPRGVTELGEHGIWEKEQAQGFCAGLNRALSALVSVEHAAKLDMEEREAEAVGPVVDAALRNMMQLVDWMRSHTGPADGTHDMLVAAVESLKDLNYEIK